MSTQAPAAHLTPADQLVASLRTAPGHPLHRQLETGLRDLIRSGQVEVGAKLPSEHDLAAILGVSRHTIRHCLGVLAAEGLIERQRGRGGGTLVRAALSAPIERSLGSFYAFAWEVQARGGDQRSFVLERTSIVASEALAERLGVAVATPLERIVRLRTADGEPLVLETAYLPAKLAKDLDQSVLETGSIYDALERLPGVRIRHARERIRPVALTRSVARLFGLRIGSPAFSIERSTFSETGVVEWHESIVRGDRYLYSVDLPYQRVPPSA